jgi:hypothetical protein
MTEEPAK